MGSWEELDRVAKPEPKADDFARLCSQVFSGGPGAELLKMFRAVTIEKALPEGASADVLRDLEAQRRFVRRIEMAVERGKTAPSKG